MAWLKRFVKIWGYNAIDIIVKPLVKKVSNPGKYFKILKRPFRYDFVSHHQPLVNLVLLFLFLIMLSYCCQKTAEKSYHVTEEANS